jgi:hypothetical protein
VKTSVCSACPWLHPLKSWSLRQSRRGSDRKPARFRQTGNLISTEGVIWPLSMDGVMVDKCAAIEHFPGLS